MAEPDWINEREALLERVRKAEQVAAESQAEAAVYRDLLEECWRAAAEALKVGEVDLLYKITGKLSFGWMPSEHEGKQWGKLFLHAYMRDAEWLKHARKRLEQIKSDAEMISEDSEANDELKKKIIEAAEHGLINHIKDL